MIKKTKPGSLIGAASGHVMRGGIKISVPFDVVSLCRILRKSGYGSYVVGGSVRDRAMGIMPQDYDVTTNCLPEKTMRIFKKYGYKVIPTGLKYGTISVLVKEDRYEITTYRKDVEYADGRRPEKVVFMPALRDDLERRDLTINALAYDPIGKELVDYFGGLKDLKRKKIKAVGDPSLRFAEDYLRMLRAVRYSARFGFTIESKTLAAIKKHAAKIVNISPERILSELTKMAGENGKKFAYALLLLKRSGLLKHILPEIDVMEKFTHEKDTHPEGGLWEHTLAAIRQNSAEDAVLNLAILFHDVGKIESCTKADGRIRYYFHHEKGRDIIDRIASRLRMSGELKESLKFAAHNHMKFHAFLEMTNQKLLHLITDKNWDILYKTAYCDDAARLHLFKKSFWHKVDKKVRDLREEYVGMKKLERIKKVVNGKFVMRVKNIGPGPAVGECIKKTVEWILNNSVDVNDTGRLESFIRSL